MVRDNSPQDKTHSNGHTVESPALPSGSSDGIPVGVEELFRAIFDPADTVLIRPVESWQDADSGSRESRTVYRNCVWTTAERLTTDSILWAEIQHKATTEKASIYFGVCPRFGVRHFDLAAQIRTVRSLWADLDGCGPDEAIERCSAAGLPLPSFVVATGHGVHLYWLLAVPYQITDAVDPEPVETAFFDQGPGEKKKPAKYVIRDGERVYQCLLDAEGKPTSKANPDWLKVSPDGQRIQRIVGGIAKQIGGDHTRDLARLLRVPGTMNRKNERSGTAPVPCRLVVCEPSRRYDIEMFVRFELSERPQRPPNTAPACPVTIPDDELVARIMRSRSGQKFRSLWNGDTSAYKSASHADFEMLKILAFWTGRDRSRMETLFGQSGLGQRDKWVSRPDYRDMTIGKAIERCQNVYDPTRRRPGRGRQAMIGLAVGSQSPPAGGCRPGPAYASARIGTTDRQRQGRSASGHLPRWRIGVLLPDQHCRLLPQGSDTDAGPDPRQRRSQEGY